MSLKLLSTSLVAGIVAITSVGRGAVIGQWTFPAAATLTTATTVDPNATASLLGKGAATNALTFTNDFYASKPVMSISRSNDTAQDVYFEVTLTANSGFELNMDSWSFDGAAGGGTAGQRTYNVKSSVENLNFTSGATLASGGFTTIRGSAGGAGPMQNVPVDLSSAAYDHLSSLTMRVYFFTLTTNQNIDVDNITFNGSVVAVPEPATVSAGAALVAGMLGRRRRQR